MELNYIMNDKSISKDMLSMLRKSVEWYSVDDYFEKFIQNSYLYICCYDGKQLIGFLNVISNGCSDAYIQDVAVNPSYQGIGIGTKMMEMAIGELKRQNIDAIVIFFESSLYNFYKRFGFFKVEAGILTTDMDKPVV